MSISIAAHPYSATHGFYYNDSKSKVFLDFVKDDWKSINEHSYYSSESQTGKEIKFKDREMQDKYKDYYYQISEVFPNQLSAEEFSKLKTQIFCIYDWNDSTDSSE
jgi:hypothetical protein